MNIYAEYVATNYTEKTSSFSVQICRVAGDEFNFGVLEKEDSGTLFETPDRVYLSKMTLNELIEMKEAINKLIDRVEESVRESI